MFGNGLASLFGSRETDLGAKIKFSLKVIYRFKAGSDGKNRHKRI
jgi:hypothetical protein